MLSSTLECIHDPTMSRVTSYHRHWKSQFVRCPLWHARMALGRHIRSDYIGRGMRYSPLESTHGRTMLGVTCHLHHRTAHTVGRCWAWKAIIALRQHTQSEYFRHGMPSWPLSMTHNRTMSVVAMQSSLIECTHGNTTSDVTCYIRHLIAHTIR